MLTAAGSGYSQWQDCAITRWREDPTCDPWGSYLYSARCRSGDTWSAGHAARRRAPRTASVAFEDGRAEFVRRDGDIRPPEVAVAADGDARTAPCQPHNHGDARARHRAHQLCRAGAGPAARRCGASGVLQAVRADRMAAATGNSCWPRDARARPATLGLGGAMAGSRRRRRGRSNSKPIAPLPRARPRPASAGSLADGDRWAAAPAPCWIRSSACASAYALPRGRQRPMRCGRWLRPRARRRSHLRGALPGHAPLHGARRGALGDRRKPRSTSRHRPGQARRFQRLARRCCTAIRPARRAEASCEGRAARQPCGPAASPATVRSCCCASRRIRSGAWSTICCARMLLAVEAPRRRPGRAQPRAGGDDRIRAARRPGDARRDWQRAHPRAVAGRRVRAARRQVSAGLRDGLGDRCADRAGPVGDGSLAGKSMRCRRWTTGVHAGRESGPAATTAPSTPWRAADSVGSDLEFFNGHWRLRQGRPRIRHPRPRWRAAADAMAQRRRQSRVWIHVDREEAATPGR